MDKPINKYKQELKKKNHNFAINFTIDVVTIFTKHQLRAQRTMGIMCLRDNKK